MFRKDLIYMIELKIDSTKNELSLTHDVCCNEHLADELAIIIDIMIADYFIKNGHKYDNCSLEEKEKIIKERIAPQMPYRLFLIHIYRHITIAANPQRVKGTPHSTAACKYSLKAYSGLPATRSSHDS